MNAIDIHRKLEENAGLLIFGILFVSAIGGLVQILPSIFQETVEPTAETRPYTAAELLGRDIYIREGCSTCHSQQVRPLLAEVIRYEAPAHAGESVYDRPFLWGSKRTGPDLSRVGEKYTDEWQRIHLVNPRAVVPKSIMPAYPWLERRKANSGNDVHLRMKALQRLGHPYTDEEITRAAADVAGMTELDAIVAYLQSLKIDTSVDPSEGGH
ncbi:MAG: cytochrome-c oxidase, cbb3-type subunit II [Gammaproteobacteria bacterium]|nr:cytochrome-c oxidase, cbb3-type subunit II [Gammaproteobacteria bacterium]MYC25079.1 cytochrome-c oxidase, cbb3-type subunit II [Gammaproteobacteria bacterium]